MVKKRKRIVSETKFMDAPSTPPGFISKTSFWLKSVCAEGTFAGMSSLNASRENISQIDLLSNMNDVAKANGFIQNQQFDDESSHIKEGADLKEIDQDLISNPCLPEGVVRGCADCSDCLKVTERWRPEDARRGALEDAPIFKPTEEEFKDTLKYIASISHKAEAYGICRIVPPPSWNPPCLIKEKNIWETSRFATRVQRVDGLECQYLESESAKATENVSTERSNDFSVGLECSAANRSSGEGELVSVGSEPVPEFNLKTFNELADKFKEQYFCLTNEVEPDEDQNVCSIERELSVDDIESEYHRLIENPTAEIEVLCGDNVDTRIFGSGFPVEIEKTKHQEYVDTSWNLNNTPKLPGSFLSFEKNKTSSALFPRLQVGMCFSSCFWKVEEHHLYSLRYMHFGAPKIWYVIPGRYNLKFESIMGKYLPDKLLQHPELINRLVRQLSPSNLKSQGLPLYRCIQNPGEFIILFPATYYSGFSCGFNCDEAVKFAPIDWLPHGQNIAEIYCEERRRTLISQDKELLGAVIEAVKEHLEIMLMKKEAKDIRWKNACGKDGILTKAFKSRIQLEGNRRKYLCCPSQLRRMDRNFDATCKRECYICSYDLHLSAAQCQCSSTRYSCLIHSKQLCSCSWSEKIFVFRHDMDELNLLVEALEGKLSAVYKWAKQDIRSAIHTSILGNQMQSPRSAFDKEFFTHELATEHLSHHDTTPKGTQTDAAPKAVKTRLLRSRSVDERKPTHNSIFKHPLDIKNASSSSDSE